MFIQSKEEDRENTDTDNGEGVVGADEDADDDYGEDNTVNHEVFLFPSLKDTCEGRWFGVL